MKKTEVYELLLKSHVTNMMKEIITTQNACNVLREGIIKELEVAMEAVFSKYGNDIHQRTAFVFALDSFRCIELTKLCILLSTNRLPTNKVLETLDVKVEHVVIDGAEKMAQILQEGFHEGAVASLAMTLNIKGTLFNELSAMFQIREET